MDLTLHEFVSIVRKDKRFLVSKYTPKEILTLIDEALEKHYIKNANVDRGEYIMDMPGYIFLDGEEKSSSNKKKA